MTPAEKVAEARMELLGRICSWASLDITERLRDGGKFLETAIDDFSRAVREEAVGPAIAELEKDERFGMTCAARRALDLLEKARTR
jgi:hypothetical protein